MENLFNYKSFITNESDLSQAIKKIADGDIQTYCNLKDFFLYRFPLIPISTKDKFKQLTFDTLKQMVDKDNNAFAKSFIGWMYWTGTGIDLNDELAKIYINQSAKEHNSAGLVELGILYAIGGIEGKPNHYTALNYFEEAMQNQENGYAALMLGVLNAIDNNRSDNSIKHLQKALSLEITTAAVELANIMRGLGKLKDAYQLYSITTYNPTSLLQLGILLLGLVPDIINIDYVKSFQCFLIAQALGHPYAAFYISKFKHGNSSELSILSNEIEMTFNNLITVYESSPFEIPKTAQDIFHEMKNQFEKLKDLNITQSMIKTTMSINDFVNFSAHQCVLSSTFIENMQVSIEENNFQYLIEQGYNKEIIQYL